LTNVQTLSSSGDFFCTHNIYNFNYYKFTKNDGKATEGLVQHRIGKMRGEVTS
jgi:hypothetical protein